MFNKRTFSAALITTLVLAACGGGTNNVGNANANSPASAGASNGDASNNTPTPTAPATQLPTPTGTPPNQTVSTPAYAADSDLKQAFFSDLNNLRSQWGLSLLAQHADLDVAANAHARYLGLNFTAAEESEVDPVTNLLYAHSEEPDLPGFTGSTPQQRAKVAGYPGSAGEVVIAAAAGTAVVASSAALGHNYFASFMNTVYHRDILMNDCLRDLGIGYAAPSEFVVDLGLVGAPTPLPANFFYTYPIDGATNIIPTFNPVWESPNPLPNAPGIVGPPISLAVGTTHQLVVTTFTLIDNLGNNVPVQLIDAANDTKQNNDGPNIAVIVPLTQLNLGTTYTALFTGSVDGASVSKTFHFTTLPPVINGPAQSTYTITSGNGITVPFLAPSGSNSIRIASVTGGPITNLQIAPHSAGITITSVSVSSPATLTFALSDSLYPNVPTKNFTVLINP